MTYSELVPVRLPRELVEELDRLVEKGVFKSRSHAMRVLIQEGLKRYEKTAGILRGVEALKKMEKEQGSPPIVLEGGLEELLEDRRRL